MQGPSQRPRELVRRTRTAWQNGSTIPICGALALLGVQYLCLLGLGGRYDAEGERPRGSFRTLRGVISLFRTPRVVLVGWMHCLAFDLVLRLVAG